MKGDEYDPKGLIFEAYRIENVTIEECRSIFLDWALSMPMELDTSDVLRVLIGKYEGEHPEHPMSKVMHEGLKGMAAPRRRGGWRSRIRN